MRLPSHPLHRLAAATLLTGLAALLPSGSAGADAAPLTVAVSGNVAFSATIVVSCESPAVPSSDGVDIAGAATAEQHTLAVDGQGGASIQINDLADGSACSVTASGPEAAHLDAVDGGIALVGSDGQVRGVAVTVDRGTPVTAHLTFEIPAVIPTTVSPTATSDGNAAR